MQECLKVNCTDFITKDQWPPNSKKPLDYHLWGAMLQAFHKLQSKRKTIPELKSILQQNIWDDLPQITINNAIVTFAKVTSEASFSADGGHFEHIM